MLNSLGLYDNIVDVIACPTCGRLEYDLFPVVKELEEYTKALKIPLKIAILGCVVNGPGEAKQADLGIAGGKNGGIIFKKGKIYKSCKQEELVPELKLLIDEYYQEWQQKTFSNNKTFYDKIKSGKKIEVNDMNMCCPAKKPWLFFMSYL